MILKKLHNQQDKLRIILLFLYSYCTLFGIFIVMNTGNYTLLMISHISFSIFLCFTLTRSYGFLKRLFTSKLFLPLILFFTLYCLVSFQYLIAYPLLNIFKGFFLIILNFIFGLYVTYFALKNFFSFKYLYIIFVFSYIFILIYFILTFKDLRIQNDILRLKFEKDDNLYQTFSSYLLRFYLFGYLLFIISELRNARQPIFTTFLFYMGLASSFISMVVGSNKEPVLFVILSLLLFNKISLRSKLFFITIISLAFFDLYSKINGNQILLPRLFQDGLSSLESRREILKNFSDQFMINPIIGSPLGYEELNQIYIHSFFPSILTSTGLIGFSLIILFFLMFLVYLNKLRSKLPYLIFILFLFSANVTSYFDWFPFWYLVGLFMPLKYVHYES
jgi:hypothetical protein